MNSLDIAPALLLPAIILLPLLGALLIALAGRWPNLREVITLLTSVGLLLLVVLLYNVFMSGEKPALHLVEMLPGLSLALALEPLGMLFALVASGLWLVSSVYSIGYMRGNQEKHQTAFFVCFAVAIAATMGIALSANLLTLFVFYEVLTLSTYPLVTHKRNADAVRAGRIYLGILLSTSVGLLMVGIFWVFQITGTLDFVHGGILQGKASDWEVAILFVLFVYGVGKAALMPIHRWLPNAMVAPTPVSALLHAVAVVKAGVFTVTKVTVYIFGVDLLKETGSADWLVIMAAYTIVAASVVALRADNLKRRLAYSTIAQLSYVLLAVAILAPFSIMGAVFHIAAHAAGKITLFFAAGSIYTAAHKTKVSELDGIGRRGRMPLTMVAFAIGSISMIGLPPAAGFSSKWFILQGVMMEQLYLIIPVIIASTLLNASYFLPIVYRAFLKPPPPGEPRHGEAPWPMLLAISITAALTVLLFFNPAWVLPFAEAVAGLSGSML